MPDNELGIVFRGRDESASSTIKKIEANIKGLEADIIALQTRITSASQTDLTIKTNVEGLQALHANLKSLEGVLVENKVLLQEYQDKLNSLRAGGVVDAGLAREKELSPFTKAPAESLATNVIGQGNLSGATAELERQLAVMRQLGATAGEYTSIQSSQLATRLAVLQAETQAMKDLAKEKEAANVAQFAFAQRIAPQESITNYRRELQRTVEEAEKLSVAQFKFAEQIAPSSNIAERLQLEKNLATAESNIRRMGLEEEKRLGAEAVELKRQAYRNIADDAAKAAAAEIAAQSKVALSAAAIRQMPIVGRVRLWGADDATKEAAGLDFYANATARVRAAIENTANSARRMQGAISDFHRELSHAGGNIDQTTYAVRKLITVLDETARGQSGQRISTIGSAIRDLGVGRALPIIAPIGLGLAAIEVTHLVSEYSKLATKTDDAARAAGVGVEEYSRLARVLQLAGISAERLPTAMGQLSQSIRTAITEPLSAKGTAFAEIFGKDFFTDLPKFEEEPLKSENIDKLRQKYQELARTVGEFQAMGVFRAALGRTEWVELAPLITAAETEYQKWNKAVADSHLPFTSGEVEKLREVDFATKKLAEDWEYLGKATALFAGNTGLIAFIDSVVLKLGALARNSREAGIALESIGTGIVVGGAVGTAVMPGLGTVVGAGLGAIGGGVAGAKIAEGTRPATGPRPGPEPGSIIVPVPPRPPGTPISTPSEASTREEAGRRANIPTTTSDDERSQYPQLYGFGGAKIAPESLVSEAVKYREEIEQTHRVIEARLDAEKTEALGRARSETDRQRIEEDFSRREAANRAKAVQEERDMLTLYRQRMQDVSEPVRPLAEKDLSRRVGVQIEVEEFNTRKKLAQEEERFRREGFRVYDEEKRVELQLAKGNAAQIEQIYQERLAAAKAAFGEEGIEFKRLQLEHIEAAQAATNKMLQDRMRIQDTIGRISETEIRITAAGMEAGELDQTIGKKVDHTAAYKAEQVLIQQTAASQIEAYQAIAAAAGENTEIKIQNLEKAALWAENAANQEVQLARKISQEMHKAAEESSKVFVQFFDKTGSAFETFIDDAVFRTKTWQQATRDLILGIDKDLLHTTEKLGSQLAAQGLAQTFGVKLESGKGIGDLLGQMAGRALGLAPGTEDKQALTNSLAQDAKQQRGTVIQILGQIRDAATAQAQNVGTIQAGAGIPRTAERLPPVKVPVERDTLSPIGQRTVTPSQVSAAGQKYGFSPGFSNAVVDIESSHGANMGDPRRTQYGGNVLQLNEGERRRSGFSGSGMGTPEEQLDYGFRNLSMRREELKAKLGRDVTEREVFLAHNQGVAGASGLLANPTTPAGVVIRRTGEGPENISGNFQGNPNAPAQEFVNRVYSRLERGEERFSRDSSATSATSATSSVSSQTSEKVQQLGQTSTTTASSLEKLGQAADKIGPSVFGSSGELNRGEKDTPAWAFAKAHNVSAEEEAKTFGLPAPYAYGGPVYGFQYGGMGTDTIQAMLTPGEFVVKNAAVGHYGVDFLHSINNMALPKGFAAGGKVGEDSSPDSSGWLSDLFGSNKKPDRKQEFWNLWPLPERQKSIGMTLGASSRSDFASAAAPLAPIPQSFLSQVDQLPIPETTAPRSFSGSQITANASRFQSGGEVSKRIEDSDRPSREKYFPEVVVRLPETSEQASEAIRQELAGENRTYQEIMTSLSSSGYALRQEDRESGARYAGKTLTDLPSRSERKYWENYATGIHSQIGQGKLSSQEALKDAERVAPIGNTGIYTQSVREAFLSPREQTDLTIGEAQYGMFPGSAREMVQPQGFAQGGSVAYFSFGGINTPPPLANTPQPYKGTGSPMTTPTISGGFTTESRGFVSPTLYTVHPKPNLGGLLAILGIGAVGLAGVVGLEKLLSNDEKKKAERLLAAKETTGGWTGQGIPDRLSEDSLRSLSTSQISGLPDDVSGLCGGGAVGLQEGGIARGENTSIESLRYGIDPLEDQFRSFGQLQKSRPGPDLSTALPELRSSAGDILARVKGARQYDELTSQPTTEKLTRQIHEHLNTTLPPMDVMNLRQMQQDAEIYESEVGPRTLTGEPPTAGRDVLIGRPDMDIRVNRGEELDPRGFTRNPYGGGTTRVLPFQGGGIVAGMLQEQVEQQGSIFPQSEGYSSPSLFSSSTPTSISRSIDPGLASLPGTMANELYQAQVEKGMNIGLGFGPGAMKFSRLTSKADTLMQEAERVQLYAEGKEDPVASAIIARRSYDPTSAKIELMRSYLPSEYPEMKGGFAAGMGKGVLGSRFMLEAAREYFRSHPDINELSGLRVSGAREQAGSESYATIYRSMVLKGEKSGFQEGGVAEKEFQLANAQIIYPGGPLMKQSSMPRIIVDDKYWGTAWGAGRNQEFPLPDPANATKLGIPKFHTGGKASNEVIAKLLTNERVLSPDETKAYDSLPKFHSGGFVWPAFAEGGTVSDEGMVGGSASYASARGGSSSTDARAVYSSIGSLSSSMSVLSSDVEKVASGFKSLERATGPATQSTGRLSGELSAVGSALGTFKGILSSFSSMGSGGAGGGAGGAAGGIGQIFSLFGTIGGLFGLQKGGLREVTGSGGTDSQLVQFMATPGEMVSVTTPEQHRASMVGGLPHFAGGGNLTVGKSLASNVSQSIQGAASQITGGPGTSGVNVTIGSINGVMNAHDVKGLLMSHFETFARAFQRASRNNFDLPGR